MSHTTSIPQHVSAAPPQGGCISVERARVLVAAGAIVIDVRSDYDYERYGNFEYENDGRTETAVNIPVATIGKGGENELPPDREYVLICQMGQCSKTAMRKLSEVGIKSYSVDGGISAWKKSPR
jgi:rhodanese-related sulfurtransferase